MLTKKQRLTRIREIIQTQSIETQEELAEALRTAGFEVTQATVSRDIRELRLQKTRTQGGKQKYTVISENTDPGEKEGRFVRVMKEGLVSMDQAQNILVIKTISGMAMALAAALDAMQFHEIVGCIAGDDTIMCAVRSVDETTNLIGKIRVLLGQD